MQNKKLYDIMRSWHDLARKNKKCLEKIEKFFKKREEKYYVKKWSHWKTGYYLTRLKHYEGTAVKALLRANTNWDTLDRIVPDISKLQTSKAE